MEGRHGAQRARAHRRLCRRRGARRDRHEQAAQLPQQDVARRRAPLPDADDRVLSAALARRRADRSVPDRDAAAQRLHRALESSARRAGDAEALQRRAARRRAQRALDRPIGRHDHDTAPGVRGRARAPRRCMRASGCRRDHQLVRSPSANAIMGRRTACSSGSPRSKRSFDGVRYRVSAGSFFQVNVEIVARIFEFMRAGPRAAAQHRRSLLRCRNVLAVLCASTAARSRHRGEPASDRRGAGQRRAQRLRGSGALPCRPRRGRRAHARGARARCARPRSSSSIRRARAATRRRWGRSPQAASERLVSLVRSGDAGPGFEVPGGQRISPRRRAAVRHVPADGARRDAGDALQRDRGAAQHGRGGVRGRRRRRVVARTTTSRKTNRSIPTLSSEKIDVRYVAKLARIALTDDEVERFGAQLGDLLEHVERAGRSSISTPFRRPRRWSSRATSSARTSCAVPRSRGRPRTSSAAPGRILPRSAHHRRVNERRVSNPLIERSAAQIARDVNARTLSAREVAEATLAHVDAVDGRSRRVL